MFWFLNRFLFMKRIIIISGSTETLEYFSLQLARYFLDNNREVFLWDMRHPAASREAFEALNEPENSVLLTFNFNGLMGEGQFGTGPFSNIWDDYGIEKLCIMVDSPMYYFRQLSSGMQNLRLVCIDRYHQKYVEENYPEYCTLHSAKFLPLGGNRPLSNMWIKPGILLPNDIQYFDYEYKALKDRPIDALFIGNYITQESIEPSLRKLPSEYRDFIMDICDELIANPAQTFEYTLLDRLKAEFPDSTDEEYRQAGYQMVYIDLYVRSAFRGKVVTSLADSGIKVYCTGKDWDKATTKHPENIVHTGESVVSLQCIQALYQSKVSLNVMPWFKAGAHDRIFSSMLAGCAVVSDSSEYLDEIMTDGDVYLKYRLEELKDDPATVAMKVQGLLSDLDGASEMAERGRIFARNNHTWDARARKLLEII